MDLLNWTYSQGLVRHIKGLDQLPEESHGRIVQLARRMVADGLNQLRLGGYKQCVVRGQLPLLQGGFAAIEVKIIHNLQVPLVIASATLGRESLEEVAEPIFLSHPLFYCYSRETGSDYEIWAGNNGWDVKEPRNPIQPTYPSTLSKSSFIAWQGNSTEQVLFWFWRASSDYGRRSTRYSIGEGDQQLFGLDGALIWTAPDELGFIYGACYRNGQLIVACYESWVLVSSGGEAEPISGTSFDDLWSDTELDNFGGWVTPVLFSFSGDNAVSIGNDPSDDDGNSSPFLRTFTISDGPIVSYSDAYEEYRSSDVRTVTGGDENGSSINTITLGPYLVGADYKQDGTIATAYSHYSSVESIDWSLVAGAYDWASGSVSREITITYKTVVGDWEIPMYDSHFTQNCTGQAIPRDETKTKASSISGLSLVNLDLRFGVLACSRQTVDATFDGVDTSNLPDNPGDHISGTVSEARDFRVYRGNNTSLHDVALEAATYHDVYWPDGANGSNEITGCWREGNSLLTWNKAISSEHRNLATQFTDSPQYKGMAVANSGDILVAAYSGYRPTSLILNTPPDGRPEYVRNWVSVIYDSKNDTYEDAFSLVGSGNSDQMTHIALVAADRGTTEA